VAEYVAVRRDVVEELLKWLCEKAATNRMVAQTYERIYGCSLEELEARIQREGVPPDEEGHAMWEASIEWGIVAKELEELEKFIQELRSALNRPVALPPGL